MIEKFLKYLSAVRRYSPKTIENYRRVLAEFCAFAGADCCSNTSGESEDSREFAESQIPSISSDPTIPLRCMVPPLPCRGRHAPGGDSCSNSAIDYQTVRDYEVYLIDARKEKAATVNQHLSVLSSYCRFLMKEGVLQNNPVHLVMRPKQEKRLPQFYRDEAMNQYFEIHKGTMEYGEYDAKLRYMIISVLANTGIRRAELIDLNISSADLSRKVLHVHGKGDKMRDVPLVDSLCDEIGLYLSSLAAMPEASLEPGSPLLQTKKGGRLYPVFVDRAVKRELGEISGITGRKSPHVLRHTLATDLLGNGSDINSIKELLGHASLAATQVYTHNSIERLQDVYRKAHPREKKD